jgi:hypothetical protein
MENKYTLKFTFAIEIQIDKLFTLVLVTSKKKNESINFRANIFQLNVLLYVVF